MPGSLSSLLCARPSPWRGRRCPSWCVACWCGKATCGWPGLTPLRAQREVGSGNHTNTRGAQSSRRYRDTSSSCRRVLDVEQHCRCAAATAVHGHVYSYNRGVTRILVCLLPFQAKDCIYAYVSCDGAASVSRGRPNERHPFSAAAGFKVSTKECGAMSDNPTTRQSDNYSQGSRATGELL